MHPVGSANYDIVSGLRNKYSRGAISEVHKMLIIPSIK